MTDGEFIESEYQVTEENARDVASWCQGKLVHEIDNDDPEITHAAINVAVPFGVDRAHVGDIIRFNFETGYYDIDKV